MNIGIFAHVDAGKTTLTEQLLYCTGQTRALGSVDAGTSVSDRLKIEQQRGISVQSTVVGMEWKGTRIQLIDTPGHIDFAGEALRALLAPDAAVLVVSAVEGVQSHTRLIWDALSRQKIPTLFVINKLDRAGSDYRRVLKQIQKELTGRVFCLNACTNEENLGGACEITEVFASDREKAEEELLLSLEDEALTDAYLEGKTTRDTLLSRFYEESKGARCFGAVLTVAKEGKGIASLLDAVVRCLPDASSFAREGCLSATAFKIEHDRGMGRCAYIRMFSGELKNRDTVTVGGKEVGKISQIRVPSGGKWSDSGVLGAGEIGMVYGLSELRCGDTIGESVSGRKPGDFSALMMVSVLPERQEDRPAVTTALTELSAEDPLLRFRRNRVTDEMYVCITGTIQLEILEELIRDRYGLSVHFSEPQVIFKETPRIAGIGYESYTMPKPCWAKVELQISPLPRGSGVRFRSVIKDNILPYRYQHHVEQSILNDCLSQGIYGWEVTDAEITLTGGEYHSIHTHPLDFFVATPVAFLRALRAAQAILLEPILRAKLFAPEAYLGTVMGHITEMRGSFDTPSLQNGMFSLTAYLPVQESVFYPQRFHSATAGKGTYVSEFYAYRECPQELYRTLPRIGTDPLDRPKWILHCRSALGD